MNLKEEVKTLDLHAQIGDLKGVDKENKIVEIFRNVAQQILSGYFLVQKNQSDSCVKVHPTCVEIYYHEEGDRGDKIKDYIVYHRNNDDGKMDKSLFPLGILHNHVSGIDMTFEKGDNPQDAIRMSALIREFRMDDSKKLEDNYCMDYLEQKRNRRGNIVTKPTYLYDALYSQFSVFDGFSIQWVDGENLVELEEESEVRVNVPQFKRDERNMVVKVLASEGDGDATANKMYRQCLRKWNFKVK